MPSQLAKNIADVFRLFGWKWKFNGELLIPNSKDIEGALDKAKEALYAEPVPSQLEVGRLLIKRQRDETFEVYLYYGDL